MTSPVAEPADEAVPTAVPELAATPNGDLSPYDAIVLLSFGGPEAPEEVMPFLRRVTAGRGIPDERLADVANHYHLFGGKSPINDQNRALLVALQQELARRDLDLPVLWGNRNSEPFLEETLRAAHGRGMRNVVVITTRAYSCYSSGRQYRVDLAAAVGTLADEGAAVAIDKIRPYWNHPGFAATNARLVTDAVRTMQHADPAAPMPRVVCVTHSIPTAMDDTSGPGEEDGNLYSAQHQQLAAAIAEEVSATVGVDVQVDLAYCSRSGSPQQPWLEPDINDYLRELHEMGINRVVVAPIGFVSDHMEVVFDLDTEARESANELGMEMTRVPTVGTDAQFVAGLVDLVTERAAIAREAPTDQAAWPDPTPRPAVCRPGCCPNLRAAKPACCGQD